MAHENWTTKQNLLRWRHDRHEKTTLSSFKTKIVQELLKEEKSVTQLAAEHAIHLDQLRDWKRIAPTGLPSLFETGRSGR